MRLINVLCLLIGPFLLLACNNESCNPDQNSLREGGGLSFHLVDARTGQDLLAQTPGNDSPYLLDSVMVYNEKGEPQLNRPVDFRGEIAFSTYGGLTELAALPYNSLVKRRFILYLNRADQDTIDASFSIRKNECGFSEFSTITISYNTQLVYEGRNTSIIPSRVFRKK
ncbi:hypothetical protein [Hymenobacter actinosclerus]|uniref:hypothetical protein n=1 Tax=Hymenobacter actinosclerus TaxID=82805 RepID=UPI001160674B|nr:hypothetical protein [Hymenobacter actinosclerus]